MTDVQKGATTGSHHTHTAPEMHHASWRSIVRALGVTAVLTGLAWMADGWVYAHWYDPKVYDRDWGRLLRIIGFLATWLALAVAIALQEGAEPARRVLAKRRASLLAQSLARSASASATVVARDDQRSDDARIELRLICGSPLLA